MRAYVIFIEYISKYTGKPVHNFIYRSAYHMRKDAVAVVDRINSSIISEIVDKKIEIIKVEVMRKGI